VHSECDGFGSEELGCATCKECPVGDYVAVPCNGTSRLDVKVRRIYMCRCVRMYVYALGECRVTGLVDSILR
jgi:hypothetical protein